MTTRKVNNRVRLAGKIVYTHFSDKYATMVINTGSSEDGGHDNYPRTVAFERVLNVASQYKVGDYVLIDATMQSNRPGSNLPYRTIAVNHIGKLDPDSPEYHTTNRFDFYGRIVKSEKLNDNYIKATVAILTKQMNYITVYLETEDSETANRFLDVKKTDFVHLMGFIQTDRKKEEEGIKFYDRLVATKYKVLRSI